MDLNPAIPYAEPLALQSDPRSAQADAIIRHFMMMTAGAGALPVVLADILAVSAIQLEMIRQLCHVYGIPYERARARAVVMALVTNTLVHRGARSLTKKVPVIGWLIGGASMALLSAGATLALGKLFKAHLQAGGQWPEIHPEAWLSAFRRTLSEYTNRGIQPAN